MHLRKHRCFNVVKITQLNESVFVAVVSRMGAAGPISTPGVLADFPWVEIAKGKDGIVDVGGGQGTLCCSLAEK